MHPGCLLQVTAGLHGCNGNVWEQKPYVLGLHTSNQASLKAQLQSITTHSFFLAFLRLYRVLLHFLLSPSSYTLLDSTRCYARELTSMSFHAPKPLPARLALCLEALEHCPLQAQGKLPLLPSERKITNIQASP